MTDPKSTTSTTNNMLAGIKRGKKKKAAPVAPQAAAASRETNVSAAAALKAALSVRKTPEEVSQTTTAGTSAATERLVMTTAALPTLSAQREEEMSAAALAAHERRSGSDAYEEETRALWRAHKRRKPGKNDDSDEEVDQWQARHTKTTSEKHQAKIQKRWQAGQAALDAQQNTLAQQSWWWMDSKRFDATSLVAMSDTVSLVLAPAHKSWHPHSEKYPHFYLVPLPATSSGAACDETVWQDVQKYQNSLRQWAQSQGKDIMFAEVVMPSNKKAAAFYQAKLHAMVVPQRLQQDAGLVFQSAMQELLLEHSTHQKKIRKLQGKPLPYMVPSHFAYLYVEYGPQQGFVLVLEERSRDVTLDWPLDVLGGRLGLDPVRMRPKNTAAASMAERVLALQETWKDFDWNV